MIIPIKELVKQMHKDFPYRYKNEKGFATEIEHIDAISIDLACAYGWYLGMFQVYARAGFISDKKLSSLTHELIKIYSKYASKIRQNKKLVERTK